MRTERIAAVRYLLAVMLMSFSTMHGCLVRSACINSADCKAGQVCHIAPGTSKGVCRNTRLVCPEGMVPIERRFCIDMYEASRPDATADSEGTDSAMAVSRSGVLPWRVENNAEAAKACRTAGKSLCTEDQWLTACRGSSGTVYSYGDEYSPLKCNGIDTYCFCDSDQACGDRDPCPYPYCYHDCGASFRVEPTGRFTECTNDFGVFDMNGNVWEHVLDGDDTRIRGGAYNCSDSKTLHRCDYIPGDWEPSARGFRCCAEGLTHALPAHSQTAEYERKKGSRT
jgi:sulfatase modifying factor 1